MSIKTFNERIATLEEEVSKLEEEVVSLKTVLVMRTFNLEQAIKNLDVRLFIVDGKDEPIL